MLNYLNRRLFCHIYLYFSSIFAFFCFQIIPKLTGYVELSIFRQIYAMNTFRFSNFVIIAGYAVSDYRFGHFIS